MQKPKQCQPFKVHVFRGCAVYKVSFSDTPLEDLAFDFFLWLQILLFTSLRPAHQLSLQKTISDQ